MSVDRLCETRQSCRSQQFSTDDIENSLHTRSRPVTADQLPFDLLKRSWKANGKHEPKDEEQRSQHSGDLVFERSHSESRISQLPNKTTSITTKQIYDGVLQKLKSDYFRVRHGFKQMDPEGKGIVDRDSLRHLISDLLSIKIRLGQFNKLMAKIGLVSKKVIGIDEFYAAFLPAKVEDGGYPTWLGTHHKPRVTMTATQVHAQLKEEAKKRFLDMAMLVPGLKTEGTQRVLKPEFRNALGKYGFILEDDEFEKLWSKYDKENIGVIHGEKLLNQLGIELIKSEDDKNGIKKDEMNQGKNVDVLKWLRIKFRHGASDMYNAFLEFDLQKKGFVSLEDMKNVLNDYELDMNEDKLKNLLQSCNLPTTGPIDYKSFLRKFQTRDNKSLTHQIMTANDEKLATEDNTKAIKLELLKIFQLDFLSLMMMFRKLDRDRSGSLAPQQFRAAIESKFSFGINDLNFADFLATLPRSADGGVLYEEFMSRFDTRDEKSLFDGTSSSLFDRQENEVEQCQSTSPDPTLNSQDRTLSQLKNIIGKVARSNSKDLVKDFEELDKWNSQILTKKSLDIILKRFGIYLNENETETLWSSFITNVNGCLEFKQFLQQFSISNGYNSKNKENTKKMRPPKGDRDFRLVSKTLSSTRTLVEDQLRTAIEINYDSLVKRFKELDPKKSGYIEIKTFQTILKDLCPQLSVCECIEISRRFDIEGDTKQVSWVEFLKPFELNRQPYRQGNDMADLLKHRSKHRPTTVDYNLSTAEETREENIIGIPSVMKTLLDKHVDIKSLRRKLKSRDYGSRGMVPVHYFKSTLQEFNVNLSDEEIFQILHQCDSNLQGEIPYNVILDRV